MVGTSGRVGGIGTGLVTTKYVFKRVVLWHCQRLAKPGVSLEHGSVSSYTPLCNDMLVITVNTLARIGVVRVEYPVNYGQTWL